MRIVASDKDGPMRFRCANDRIAQLVDDPLITDDVRRFASERERVNEIHGRRLANMRKASS